MVSDVDPGQVRVAGTVARIDTSRANRTANRPADSCTEHACYATIRIDSVLGYGSGFPRPLSPGDTLRARFAFTLAPSDIARPDIVERLPGLEEGDAFRADLRVESAPGADEESTFVVYEYTRMKRQVETRP